MLIGKPTPQGYAVITNRATGRIEKEADTYTCSHCQRIIHVPSGKKIEEVGDICRGCMAVICRRCSDIRAGRIPDVASSGSGPVCVTFMRKIEAEEDKEARRRDLLRSMGI